MGKQSRRKKEHRRSPPKYFHEVPLSPFQKMSLERPTDLIKGEEALAEAKYSETAGGVLVRDQCYFSRHPSIRGP